ncbi:MAG: hypothetical protein J6R57_02845 [Bacteroidales bacterium]|nr:hypothetical protein [Bacteroidales bacterium]
MTTYTIIARTNSWIAKRDPKFNGKCNVILKSGLSLKEAKAELLSMFNEDYEMSCPNWGVAMNSRTGRSYCSHYSDDTYSYEYDSRNYYIEEEVEEL